MINQHKRRILYVTGSRADYGLMRNTLSCINKKLDLYIVVAGMHLLKEFGSTDNEIKKDNFKLIYVDATYEEDNYSSMSSFLGCFICKLTRVVSKLKPDIILVLGDRAEMLAAAAVGSYMKIPVGHVHGGDVSSTVDDQVRHAITKLSAIHFPATKKSAERILRMSEEPFRVHVVGAPGLDDISNAELLSRKEVGEFLNLNYNKPIILVVQHPAGAIETCEAEITDTMEAIKEMKLQAVIVYPNSDAGGRRMIRIIERYRYLGFVRIFKNIGRKQYLSIMNCASVLIGNSSSGIIEAASFKLPVINLGTRQDGRERAENVIDSPNSREAIISSVNKALNDKNFRDALKHCKNPYGDGLAGKRISDVLLKIKIDDKLLNKKLAY